MGEINIPRAELEALTAVDDEILAGLVDQCLREGRSSALRPCRLDNCGPYVVAKARAFEQALETHSKAKAPGKRAETGRDALAAGGNLLLAVRLMKQRMAKEEEEEARFHVDDLIVTPHWLSEKMSVRVSYRWRESRTDSWTYGGITVFHDVDVRPDYAQLAAKRKPSAARQAQDKQQMLYSEWEHLKSLALQAVRDFLRSGGSGAAIPESFQAKVDPRTRRLNNFSAEFWR